MNRPALSIEQHHLAANTLRMLAVDAVEKANSGHPGLPMGAADFAFLLWHRYLRFNPLDPQWQGRDRFILSAGHGSMLLYGLLHLFGYELPIEELQRFRQWGSHTPGHPEFGHTPGVEVTTGPLGQGFANAVGMALAARMAAARCGDDTTFNPATCRIFVLASDGDLMEGISHEAASLAGHLQLGNLICLYDCNRITIEGNTSLSLSDDVTGRFAAYGWKVEEVDGHDVIAVDSALASAVAGPGNPTLIACHTHIGWGSPGRQDSAEAHGSPLGALEVATTRRNLGWPDKEFHIPAEIRELCNRRVTELQAEYDTWQKQYMEWRRHNPEKARLWDSLWDKRHPASLTTELTQSVEGSTGATRTLSGIALNRAAALMPSLVGGSADLAPSTNTWLKESQAIIPGSFAGRNLHFGIREHAMGAVLNGMARFGCFIPFGATFLVFSDYCRPAIRLAALMQQQVIYVFTHDSIFVGEDGPTHQPVEQLSSLRLIPGLSVLRPADAMETALAWTDALKRRDAPTALILTRQKLPAITRDRPLTLREFRQGGYIVQESEGRTDVVIMASGSELSLAIDASCILKKQGVSSRILSIPCLESFLRQPITYRRRLLKGRTPRIVVEAGCKGLWGELLGSEGLFIGINQFGASAPEKVLAEQYGLTPSKVAERIAAFLGK